MNYTLDTDAIRKRFAEAIIGIRADGTMAVLVRTEGAYGSMPYFDLVRGASHLCDEFPTLIRPGDRCEMAIDQYSDWEPVYYMGYRGPYQKHMFAASTEADMTTFSVYGAIRPLPAPVAKPNPDLELAWALILIENAEHELDKARAALERASK